MKVILKHIYCSHVQTYICVYVWRILVVFLSLPAAVTFDLWIRYRKETKKKQPKDSTSKWNTSFQHGPKVLEDKQNNTSATQSWNTAVKCDRPDWESIRDEGIQLAPRSTGIQSDYSITSGGIRFSLVCVAHVQQARQDLSVCLAARPLRPPLNVTHKKTRKGKISSQKHI